MRISRNLWLVSWTSLLNDVSSEMVYPLIGFFLTGNLGASAVVVGVIEGVAESLACFLKIASGWWSDRVRSRKWFAVAGYLISIIGKAFTAFAPGWGVVLAGRSLDKVGKGVRTAPRDALIADEADPQHRGRAFGFHKAMDTAGAVLGVLIASIALNANGGSEQAVRRMMVYALIPSLVAVAVLMLVREKRQPGAPAAPRDPRPRGDGAAGATKERPQSPHAVKAWNVLTPRLRWFFAVWFVFHLGASSDAFLFLRAQGAGATIPQVVLMYLVFNIVNALTSEPAGRLSDKFGRRAVLVCGCVVYAAVYAGFALAPALATPIGAPFDAAFGARVSTPPALAAFFVLFGVYGLQRALTDGVAKALVTDLSPSDAKATALGLLDTIAGVGVLLASVVAGILWETLGPDTTLWFGSACAAIATLGLLATPPPAPAKPRT